MLDPPSRDSPVPSTLVELVITLVIGDWFRLVPTAASTLYLVLAMQANLQWRDISLKMVEESKHNEHEVDTKDREAEVSSSSGNSGTVLALGVA